MERKKNVIVTLIRNYTPIRNDKGGQQFTTCPFVLVVPTTTEIFQSRKSVKDQNSHRVVEYLLGLEETSWQWLCLSRPQEESNPPGTFLMQCINIDCVPRILPSFATYQINSGALVSVGLSIFSISSLQFPCKFIKPSP